MFCVKPEMWWKGLRLDLDPIKYIIGRKADAQKDFKMAQGTRFGYAKRTLEINYIEIFSRQLTAINGRTRLTALRQAILRHEVHLYARRGLLRAR